MCVFILGIVKFRRRIFIQSVGTAHARSTQVLGMARLGARGGTRSVPSHRRLQLTHSWATILRVPSGCLAMNCQSSRTERVHDDSPQLSISPQSAAVCVHMGVNCVNKAIGPATTLRLDSEVLKQSWPGDSTDPRSSPWPPQARSLSDKAAGSGYVRSYHTTCT